MIFCSRMAVRLSRAASLRHYRPMDTVSKETRSRMMRAVGRRNTGPELAVRRALHAAGLRFRLHRRDLPGTPDIVLPRRRVAIFVHGCFWHGHDCRAGRAPVSRESYWGPKIVENRARDARQAAALEALGWTVLTIWECETRDASRLAAVAAELRV
jgi:DNA mismatch endonuclease (patch repair protein)